ncbi:GNAT family N-acetyltransferase [Natronoglycomyces albus]|uniref:GNAT family N-acetyltransferase n=1 Tax=Natronoglycomyces albus TaxID=2811108 RepID=A0A895XRM8_9ACTN|nr:GNAT family N-acetyltransferase [Natronoglycomyces albus]QSB05999.1 GNAT family N-acetyltransferase [Natronoglycomyces albus]
MPESDRSAMASAPELNPVEDPWPRLETERLILRRWRASDYAACVEMNADPEVMRHIGATGATQSAEQATQWLEKVEQRWSERGFGLFAIQVRDDATVAGFCGLSVPLFLPEILPAVEIGWRLRRSMWGRGYATEAAVAALKWGLYSSGHDGQGCKQIVSIADRANTASVRVMEKIGLRFERDVVVPEGQIQAALYVIDRP